MSRTLYSSVGNSNLFVREFNFTVVKGLDVKGLNLIMAPSLQSMKIAFLEKDSNNIWNINCQLFIFVQFYCSQWELCFAQRKVWQLVFGKRLTSEEELRRVKRILYDNWKSYCGVSFICLQLCVNGTALPCPESTHVKCNETVSRIN